MPLQSLVSYFLEPPPPPNRWVAVGATEGLWKGASPARPEASTILCTLVAAAQVGGGSSVLNLLCAKDQANENCEHSQVFSRFSGRLWRGLLCTFSPLLFPPVLRLLSPFMPLLTKYWAGHHLSISERCVWNHLPKIGTQTHVEGTLCYA